MNYTVSSKPQSSQADFSHRVFLSYFIAIKRECRQALYKILTAQCAESVLTIQKELNTIGHRQRERPRTWDHPYSFRITSRITIPKFLLNFLLNVYRENLWINEAPVTEKCIFHQEFTLHPQEKVFPRFLPLQNREELFHQQKGGRKPWIKELMQGNNY